MKDMQTPSGSSRGAGTEPGVNPFGPHGRNDREDAFVFLLAVLNLANPFFFGRHYDAGGYEDDENEEDMENDDEFGSDAERGKLCRALSWTQVLIMSSLLDNSRGPWAKARTTCDR